MLARDGYSNIFAALILAFLICWGAYSLDHWFSYVLYAAAFLLVVFMLYFFRDPDRDITEGEQFILSPADGNVVLVKEVEEDVYIKGPAKQISIFLSPLDVHVNRNPVGGLLEYVKYHPGKYLMAWDHRASELNERADFGVKHPSGTKVFFRQITGFMARRIVYHIKEGDQLKAGERFGMMKFGSRMDIVLPVDVEINIAEGDRAVAGETILATIKI
ncbi:MAG TPA: phosphatidylserine decarboxylase family protein [Balneolaceae bacterium]|nr:phosphatidylserine decarboxylase family protein [Balneolaceae bacterium]